MSVFIAAFRVSWQKENKKTVFTLKIKRRNQRNETNKNDNGKQAALGKGDSTDFDDDFTARLDVFSEWQFGIGAIYVYGRLR